MMPHCTSAQKKRGAAKRPASSQLGTADNPAGLGGFAHVVLRRCGLLVGGFRWNAVVLAQPAAQINQFALGAAKRELRPFPRGLALHDTLANRATYPYHRKLTT